MRAPWMLTFGLASGLGCGDERAGTTDADVGDPTATDATTTDAVTTDVGDAETAEDATPDATADATADAANDADASTCAPVDCDLACPHGFRHDASGCDVCACRECDDPTDCAGVITCDTPTCSDGGACLCDCTGVAPEAYTCPDGTDVPRCACADRGTICMDHPELQCPTLCSPHAPDAWPCPDGSTVPWCACDLPSCEPVCQHVGEPSEGWYDGCSGALVAAAPCAGCSALCQAIGSRSEGYYSSCDGALIGWAACAPRRECAADPGASCATLDCTTEDRARGFLCPDGSSAPHCACDVPASSCPAVCLHVGASNEGWYDACSGTLLRAAKCAGCTATCDAIGSKSEGWYSSCDGLIAWAACATGTWSCADEPWRGCDGPRACVPEGGSFIAPDVGCCPGLVSIEYATWDGEHCGYVDCLCAVCTLCGNGVCDPPENRCNCAADCPTDADPLPLGALCGADAECADGLTCLRPGGGGLVGVCTRVCSLGAEEGCGDGAVCTPLPTFQAPGFCLLGCESAADCASPLACGSDDFGSGRALPSTCFAWPPCDPLADTGCGSAEQCRVASGQATCGIRGTLERGDKCDRELDLCGPGLTCGALDQCWPTCADDDACRADALDFCLKKPAGAPYGHCMFLE